MGLFEVLVVAFFFIGMTGGDCAGEFSEASCGSGCVWTNLTAAGCIGSGGGKCGGNAICDGATQNVCQNSTNPGCNWVPSSSEQCDGTWTCAAQTDQGVCGGLDGCNWEQSAAAGCGGAPSTCSGLTSENCQLGGCSWKASATPATCSDNGSGNQNVSCSSANAKSNCEAIGYCEWRDPKPEGCYLEWEGNLSCSDLNDYEEEGALFCGLLPGCSYSGSLGTCTGGQINIECAEIEDRDVCSDMGCNEERSIACSARPCDSFGENECQSAGCTWDSEQNNCDGTPTLLSAVCDVITHANICDSTNGCEVEYLYKCIVPPSCDFAWNESSCIAAGCVWNNDNNSSSCSGTVSVTEATCDSKQDRESCYQEGCYWEAVYTCSGTPRYETCSDIEIGGSECEEYGCTSNGVSAGSCSGNVNYNAGSGATTEEECDALGVIFDWSKEREGQCIEPKTNVDVDYKKCSNFTVQGGPICYGVGCIWAAEIPAGCSGTPKNEVGDDCATKASASEEVCTGNGCTWHGAGDAVCEGAASDACAVEAKNVCETTGGCRYTAAVQEHCAGANGAFCNGGNSSTCTAVHGCLWTSITCSALDQTTCSSTDGCGWTTGTGTCASNAASLTYAPEILIGILLILFLLM